VPGSVATDRLAVVASQRDPICGMNACAVPAQRVSSAGAAAAAIVMRMMVLIVAPRDIPIESGYGYEKRPKGIRTVFTRLSPSYLKTPSAIMRRSHRR
jgi:hypothetical protein